MKLVRNLCVFVLMYPLAMAPSFAEELVLDDTCVVNILNRTVQVQADGTWFMPNVPANFGLVRARATCLREGGSVSGTTDYFRVQDNVQTVVPPFELIDPEVPGSAAPVSIEISNAQRFIYEYDDDGNLAFVGSTSTVTLDPAGPTFQLGVTATYADGSTLDVTSSTFGTNYSSSNPAAISVGADGLVSALTSGSATIAVNLDGALAVALIEANLAGDNDLDGLPDDYESANGLDPNDPADAAEDQDGDGLTALEEFQAGTNPQLADTDGDGIEDGEELIPGEDGVITDATNIDTDDDGLNDGLEILVGSDPNDDTSADIGAALASVDVTPNTVLLTFNGIDSEVSTQLSVTGILLDNTEIDLTQTSTYSSSDLAIASFGAFAGEIFGGSAGDAVVTVSAFGIDTLVPVTVETFQPVPIAQLAIPGSGKDSEISGDTLFVAASSGMHIIDVSDRTQPSLITTFTATAGNNDIKVVGNVAYLAVGNAGLDLVDISDRENPALLSNIDLAGTANDLAATNDRVYVSLANEGLAIVDVSDPLVPLVAGTLGNLGQAVGVDAQGDRAVIASTNSLIVVDVADPTSPMRLGSVNIGQVRAAVMDGDYAYVAAYTAGYKIVDISNPMLPAIVGSGTGFYPSDVELTNGFAFFTDILFVNAVPFVDITDPENPPPFRIIDIRTFGDRDAFGLSLDASYGYSVAPNQIYIWQYRLINDNLGIDPDVAITAPTNGEVVVENQRILITADASDDVAVGAVNFEVDGVPIFTDTTRPYQVPITVPTVGLSMQVTARAVDLGGNDATDTIILAIEPDEDDDGLGDTEEVETWFTDPLNPDTDGDGLLDGDEVERGTNPLVTDSDGDGLLDGEEVAAGTDPLNPDITPPTVSSTDPAEGAVDVPENNPISIVFDEPLSPASINEDTMEVIQDVTNQGLTPVAGSFNLVGGNTELLFIPDGLMADFSPTTVTVSGVRDEAGNPIATDFVLNFETGNLVDTVRPSVADSSPAQNATQVAVNALVTVILSEPIVPATVTGESFYVRDLSTGQNVDGVTIVSDDKASITFIPNAAFPVGRQHRVTLTSGITDLFGNTLPTTFRNFTTDFEPDGDGPQVAATSVSEGMTDVPTNAKFAVRFNEAINALFVTDVKVLKDGLEVPSRRTLSSDKRRLVLEPFTPLDPQSSYQFFIDGIQDTSGNLLANAVTINVTTGDGADTAPANGMTFSIPFDQKNVPLNTEISVRLNERIDATTVTNSIMGNGSGISSGLYDRTQNRYEPVETLVSADGQTLTLVLGEALQPFHRYEWYVSWNARLTDLAGNQISNQWLRFDVGGGDDSVAPVVATTNIPDGSTVAPVNGRIVVQLDEPLGGQCDVASGLSLTDGGVPVAFTTTVSANRLTVTVTPTDPLAASTAYVLSATNLCDFAGNTLTGDLLSFTTGASDVADTTAPSVVSVTPVTNSVDVPVDTSVVVQFSEVIDQRARPPLDGAGVTVQGTYEVNGDTLTFTPNADLRGATRYDLRLRWTIFDLAGNQNYLGDYRFTTESVADTTPPTLEAISPAENAVDVAVLGTTVELSFSEPMNPNTLNSNTIALYVDGTVIRPSVFRSGDGQQVSLSATLPANSLITVVLTDGVQDLSGNALAPLASSFTTGGTDDRDNGRPAVSRVQPANNTSNWFGVQEVVLYMNETIDAASLDGGFFVAENGVIVNGTTEVLGNGRTIRFTANAPFAEGALVQVYLQPTVTDDSGNAVNTWSSLFRMGTTDERIGTRHFPTAYFPFNGQTDVAVNPVFYASYNEELDAASLTDANVTLRDLDNGNALVAVDYELDATGRLLKITPEAPLAANNRYQVFLWNTILDTDGDRQWTNYASNFTTGDGVVDDRQPLVTAMSPTSGETGVGVNAAYAVRYDEVMNPLTFDTDGNRYAVTFSESNRVVRYSRLETLTPLAEKTEDAPAMVDASGNGIVPFSTTFTAGDGPDFTQAVPTYTTMEFNQQNVALNPVLEWQFAEPLDPSSLSPNGVYMYDNVDRVRIGSSYTLSPDGKRITIVPDEILKVGRQYYYYAYNLRDLSGNATSNNSNVFRYFTTGITTDDASGPVVDVASVVDGQTDVPTNPVLRVRFDEIIAGTTLDTVTLTDAGANPVPANITRVDGGTTVQVVPKQLLDANAVYTLSVDGAADLYGNVQGTPFAASFTTAATADLFPVNGMTFSIPFDQQNVPLNTEITVRLNERIDPTKVTNSVMGNGSGISSGLYDRTQNRYEPVDTLVSADGQTLTLIPGEPLQPYHQYEWYVSWNARLTDLAGNQISNQWLRFVTGAAADSAAPGVAVANIAEGSTIVPVNGRIVLELDEPLGGQCDVNAGLSLEDGGVPVAFTATVSSNRRTVTVTPTDPLATSTGYVLSATNLCDFAGNTLTGDLLNFTTSANAAVDTTAPSVLSITPVFNAQNVPVDTTVVVQFSEAIDQRARPPLDGGGATIQGTYEVNGDTLTFTPDAPLRGSTRYDLRLRWTVFDLAGNQNYLGDYLFTTESSTDVTPPTLEAVSPVDSAVDVAVLGTTVELSFSEPLNASTVNANTIALYANGGVIRPSVFRSATGQQVSLSATLPANSIVSVVVTDGVRDLSGNALAPFASSFTTGAIDDRDNGRPAVSRVQPANNTSNWFGVSEVVLYMNEVMDAASLDGGLFVAQNGALVDGTIELLGNGRTIRFTPDTPFAESSLVQVYLQPTVTDDSGNAVNTWSSLFRMGTTDERIGTRHFPTAYFPFNGQTDVAVNPVFYVSYNEELDAASLTDANVTLRDLDNGSALVAVDYELDATGRLLKITPEAPLAANNRYQVFLWSTILDTDGDRQWTNYASAFTTGDGVTDDRQPLVTAMSPTSGETGVGVNAAYAVRYDEIMNPLTFDTDGNRYAVTFSESNRVVRYSRLETLTPLGEKTEDAPAMVDASGNGVVPFSTTFTAGDGPDFAQAIPTYTTMAFNQQNVALNPVLEWQFAEPLDPSSLSPSGVYMYNNTDRVTIGSSYTLSSDGKRITIVPDAPLDPAHQYYYYAYNLRDLSGNATSNNSNVNRYFTTGTAEDTVGPVLEQGSVVDGQIDVPTNPVLRVRFDEIIAGTTLGGVSLTDAGANPVPVTITQDAARSTIIVVPRQLLDPNATYTLAVSGITDLYGNALVDPYSVTFTTADTADLVAQSGITFPFPWGTTGVPTNVNLEALLSERIDPTTINDSSNYLRDNVTRINEASTWTLSPDGRRLTIIPNALLQPNRQYDWWVSWNARFTDLSGNPITNTYLRLTTGGTQDNAAPVVLATNIPDGEVDVPVNARVELTFSEPLSNACALDIVLNDGATQVPVTAALQANRAIVRLTPQGVLAASTTYDVDVVEVCDYADNALSADDVLTFTTRADATPDTVLPSITSTTPTANQTGIALDAVVTLVFNEPVDDRTTLALYNGSTLVPGSTSVNGNIVTFTPDEDLQAGTRHRLDIRSRVVDYALNNRYQGDLYFTTQ